jgi:hypothetical protein
MFFDETNLKETIKMIRKYKIANGKRNFFFKRTIKSELIGKNTDSRIFCFSPELLKNICFYRNQSENEM